MVYLGSKSRIAKYIVPIIQSYIDDYNIDTYIELFVGGANVIDKIKCEKRIGYDINDELIALLKCIQSDKAISIAPEDCSFEHYKDVRENRKNNGNKYSKEYTALIGFCASYAGRYFDGGYGRDRKSKRNMYVERLANLKKQAPLLNNIIFNTLNYIDLDISQYNNCLFYLDPPYKGVMQYGKYEINYDDFYNFCRKLSKNNIVIISEYYMPDDFVCIWERELSITLKSDRIQHDTAIERLFIISDIINT